MSIGSWQDDLAREWDKALNKGEQDAEKAAQEAVDRELTKLGLQVPAAAPSVKPPTTMMTLAGKSYPAWMIYVGMGLGAIVIISLVMGRKK